MLRLKFAINGTESVAAAVQKVIKKRHKLVLALVVLLLLLGQAKQMKFYKSMGYALDWTKVVQNNENVLICLHEIQNY